ncbi:MAG: PAS domain S-box protein [Deltaproteobacteria bacterium]|nr:PAS domain S-box protein [Deltaproteobacteria bacterium]
MKKGKGVAGLERGLAGLGIRGIAPIYYDDVLVGTIEIGYPFGMDFLQDLKLKWGPDFTVYEKNGENTYLCLATTLKYCDELRLVHYLKSSELEEPAIVIAPPNAPDKSFTLGPIRDYGGEVVALVKIEKDRSEILRRLNNTRTLMVLVGLAGIFVSSVVVWIVSAQFTRPIGEIVKEAQEIADEKREIHLDSRPDDEIGLLTRSLNSMLESLKNKRLLIEDYARTLEKRVEERTADLILSEEKYRTLIEQLPLIVYRLLNDGTVELVNPYFENKLGYSVDEVVRDRTFWWEKIYGRDKEGEKDFLSAFGEEGKEYRAERIVRDKQGRPFTFIDRMIPMRDDFGKVKWIDGIMVDITELKKLQERELQTEEVRILGEISARFAHEIRNPLVIVGGFARRLCDSLPKDDKNGNLAQIIVEEVSRLEQLLRIMLSSIEPDTLRISELDLNQLLRSLLNELEVTIKKKGIRFKEDLSPFLPKIQCDEGLLSRAFEAIVKHAIFSMPEEDILSLSTSSEDGHLLVIIRHKEEGLLKEDLDQYFFPRFTNNVDNSSEELPLSKVIIYRHGGKVVVSEEKGSIVVIRIDLPIRQQH